MLVYSYNTVVAYLTPPASSVIILLVIINHQFHGAAAEVVGAVLQQKDRLFGYQLVRT